MTKTFAIKTFGCQMNISDSERVSGFLEPLGWKEVDLEANPNMVIFNTCSIRQKAEDRVIGFVHNLNLEKKKNPNLRVGITGCMVRKTGLRRDLVQSERDDMVSNDKLFRVMPGLDFVFRIEELPILKDQLVELYPEALPQNTEQMKMKEDFLSYLNIQPKYQNRSQIFVPIMTGCNHFCTYCIVPFSRGREISRPLEKIVAEVQAAAEKGVTEVTLLGQNVNSYQMGNDASQSFYHKRGQQTDFVTLLQEIDKIPGITRIRYTSSHPRDFDDDLIQAHVELNSMCNYVHLPVQSGDNDVLKRMNREYQVEEFIDKMQRLKKAVPDVAISTDIIVGFSGETEAQFENTLKLTREVEFDLIYLAQYSPRSGTYAGDRMKDDVPGPEKHRRWHALNDLLAEVVYKKNQKYQDQQVEVLVEEQKQGVYIGKSREWKTVRFSSDRDDLVGQLVSVKVTDPKTWILDGVEVGVNTDYAEIKAKQPRFEITFQ